MSPMINKRETELFLKAFEKPTQKYRYLREHHLFSPLFLHRNLSYMTGRMSRSRTNSKRKISQSLDMWDTVQHSKKRTLDVNATHSMRLEFFSFFDKKQPMHTLTKIEFIALNGRTDSKIPSQHTLKAINLRANTDNDIERSEIGNVVDITMEDVKGSKIGGNTVIKIRASSVPKWSSQLAKRGNEQFNGMVYETDLVIFDEAGKCMLPGGGEFELKLESRTMDREGVNRNLQWQERPRLHPDHSSSRNRPTLMFRMHWLCANQHVSQDCNGNVNRCNANSTQVRDGNISDSSNGCEREMCTSASSNCSRSSSTSGRGTMIDKVTKPANNSSMTIARLKNWTSRIIYRFIYNKNMSQQTETFDNWSCPWCKLECIRLYSLVMHLQSLHDDFQFEFTPTNDAVIIDVTISAKTGGKRRSSLRPELKEGLFLWRSRNQKRKSAEATAANMALADSMMIDGARLTKQRDVSFADGHNRLYYHSQSCTPIHTVDEFEADSEGEPDPEWLTQNCKKLVDEFTDVNEGEKALMNMWNAHVMARNDVGDLQMVDACDTFIDRFGRELVQKNLYRNFLLHLTNLFDYGLITRSTVHEMAAKFQRMHSNQYMRPQK